jgi:hypothetical protein
MFFGHIYPLYYSFLSTSSSLFKQFYNVNLNTHTRLVALILDSTGQNIAFFFLVTALEFGPLSLPDLT